MRAKSPTIRLPAPQNLAQPKAPRPTRIRPPPAATVEIARIGDTKGYYALLGITPTKAFLDIQAASVVEKELAERRRTLALKFHEDRGGGTEGEMSRINAAYDQVSTCKSWLSIVCLAHRQMPDVSSTNRAVDTKALRQSSIPSMTCTPLNE